MHVTQLCTPKRWIAGSLTMYRGLYLGHFREQIYIVHLLFSLKFLCFRMEHVPLFQSHELGGHSLHLIGSVQLLELMAAAAPGVGDQRRLQVHHQVVLLAAWENSLTDSRIKLIPPLSTVMIESSRGTEKQVGKHGSRRLNSETRSSNRMLATCKKLAMFKYVYWEI